MHKKKKRYIFAFDLGDTVWHKSGEPFIIDVIEIRKEGVIYRCGNPGTNDYWAFYENEIGTRAFTSKEEQRKAFDLEQIDTKKSSKIREHGKWLPDGGFNKCSVCGRITMQPQLTGKVHDVCPFCEAIMDLKEE